MARKLKPLTQLTAKETCKILRCSKTTLRRLIAKGYLPAPSQPEGTQPRWYYMDILIYRWRVLRREIPDVSNQNAPNSAKQRHPSKRPLQSDNE